MSSDTKVAVIGTGDMGSAVGAALMRAGFRVVTSLGGRGAHSRELALRAGLEDLGSLDAVVREADLLLSIVPPAARSGFRCRRWRAAMAATGAAPVFADCNAIAPDKVRAMAATFASLAPFADAGIVGPAPRPDRSPVRFYVAGPARRAVLALAGAEIEMIDMGETVGAASAIKMAYASLNKGTDALLTAVLLAAERLGIRKAFMRELEGSQGEALRRMRARVPFLAATAARFTGEMHEIAETYASVGVTPDFHRGAEWVYARLAETPLAGETRATLPRERSLDEAMAVFCAALEPMAGAAHS